ncbi:MAG: molecular chaperone HtpG [Erysipelotrichaceae bacterium]
MSKPFKAESRRLLDLMIHSIYTHKEIFLRELISNASDALDKLYFMSINDEVKDIDRTDLKIRLSVDKEARTLTISDNGVGMSAEEMEDNLGTIAKSGSLAFKQAMDQADKKEDVDIIGQFGVGFYSAFMVAKKVEVTSRKANETAAFTFISEGEEGYDMIDGTRETVGTSVVLTMNDDTDDDNYSQYLDSYKIQELIKKYSDYIRYPILMEVEEEKQKEDSEEYETITEEKTLNSMIPLWKRSKSDITKEDYNEFYKAKFDDYMDPQRVIHTNLEGAISFDALMFIPSRVPFNFFAPDYEKGLQLYSRGVFIMDKAKELIPDAFRFITGLVDSPDLSLNISREMLQHDRQLKAIASRLEKKIKSELLGMLKLEREEYEKFWANFGTQIKYGLYQNYGAQRELLEDLLLLVSSHENKLVTLEEYVARMKEDQKEIYYVSGETVEKCAAVPQSEWVREKGYEVLYLIQDVDEFVLQILHTYKEKTFKAINQGELDIASTEEKEEIQKKSEESKNVLAMIKEALGKEVEDVRLSTRLKTHPVCLVSSEGLSFEMEKVLKQMPDANKDIKAGRILEINADHPLFEAIRKVYEYTPEKIANYAQVLYNQALLIEGLTIENPLEFSLQLSSLMIDASHFH